MKTVRVYDGTSVREAEAAVDRASKVYDRRMGSGGYDYIRAVAILEATRKLAGMGEPRGHEETRGHG